MFDDFEVIDIPTDEATIHGRKGGSGPPLGHSDGAFVAMLVAMQRLEFVKQLVMISGGFNKNG
jgi:hypothetical protein